MERGVQDRRGMAATVPSYIVRVLYIPEMKVLSGTLLSPTVRHRVRHVDSASFVAWYQQ